ncbi:hypothetical protein [Nocardia alba]|nr:hypothetical protein [Nocardia alba]
MGAQIIVDPDAVTTRAELSAALQHLHQQTGLSYEKIAAPLLASTSTLYGTVKGTSFPAWMTLREILLGYQVPETALPTWELAHTRAAADTPSRRSRSRTDLAGLRSSLYVRLVRESIAPPELLDRGAERAMLEQFCRGDERYLWVQGEPWAGKSALLSTFALTPPSDVTVVCFFVTDRRAAQNNHTAYTAGLLDQLSALLPDQKSRIDTTPLYRDVLCNELLATAARQEAANRRRLVLVVDGLDEDTGAPPIVELLPTLAEEGLRVVVASRYGPRLPIPHGHPLASARRYRLAPSEYAAGLRDRAVAELDAVLDGPERNRELLALITAAQGLSISELEMLTDMPPFEIDRLLRGTAGRSFRAVAEPVGSHHEHDPVYALAHETLQRIAETRLGALVAVSLDRLHAWAERYCDLGWPNSTPDFLLSRYFAVAQQHGASARMATLALDAARHDVMYTRTRADWAALTEIGVVQRMLCEHHAPDLLTAAQLARHRDDIDSRNEYLDESLPVLRARLGQVDRAEALARSFPQPVRQSRALVSLSEEIAGDDPDRAERIVGEIEHLHIRADGYARLAKVLEGADQARAVELAERAEVLVDAITDPGAQATVLFYVARVVADSDNLRAERIADRADAIARSLPRSPYGEGVSLQPVLVACAGFDPGRAEALVRELLESDSWFRGMTLAHMTAVVSDTDPVQAFGLADRAEAAAREVSATWLQAQILGTLADAIAGIDQLRANDLVKRAELATRKFTDHIPQDSAQTQPGSASVNADPGRTDAAPGDVTSYGLTAIMQDQARMRLAYAILGVDPDRAETIANEVVDHGLRPMVLAAVAKGMAITDPSRAARLADQAEAITRKIASSSRRASVLAQFASAIARMDPDGAESIARGLSGVRRDDALAEVAIVIAETDPDRAETICAEIRTVWPSDRVLARVVKSVAATDPDRAETLAHRISIPRTRDRVLAHLAGVIAESDPDRAETIAHNATDPATQVAVLSRLAKIDGIADPERAAQLTNRAETIAHRITEAYRRDDALTHLFAVLAKTDPDRAETIARTFTDPEQRDRALADFAEAIAESDPDRAETIARTVTSRSWRDRALAHLAKSVAQSDPDRAETIARTFTDPEQRDHALADFAEAIAESDPDRAETIADDVVDSKTRADALSTLAKIIGRQGRDTAETHSADPGHHESETTTRTNHQRSKCLLARAWATAGWEIPIGALPTVDPALLQKLTHDVTSEQPAAAALPTNTRIGNRDRNHRRRPA